MPQPIVQFVADLLLVLTAGMLAGTICKRFGVSTLVGYLLAGAAIGSGGLHLVPGHSRELDYLAEAGALLLLFSIGIEFSLEELVRMSRYFLLGGLVQMALVALPVAGVCAVAGTGWRPAVLLGGAAALSSTVLVFKALEEWGQAASPYGRRAIGILLFQDVALVPLMLLVPLLAGTEGAGWRDWVILIANCAAVLVAVPLLRTVVRRWGVPLLASLRSTELVVLFALTLLGAAGLAAYALRLPPALGAFAAGMVLNGNRLSSQVDALVLPYRETFAAIFFVSLGTLMRLDAVLAAPLISLVAVVGVLSIKTLAADVALRAIGLRWQAAAGMGLGLAQLGEFSFLLLSEGLRAGAIGPSAYDVMLFVALVSLVLTPQLLKVGLGWAGRAPIEEPATRRRIDVPVGPARTAVVIGMGPIGSQVTSRLEISGVDVCLVDLSPVNLHPFAQQGFRTVAGDATDPEVLARAGIRECRLAVVTVPVDATARHIVTALRGLNRQTVIVVRCRYQASAALLRRAGADAVVSEEAEASGALLRLLEQHLNPGA